MPKTPIFRDRRTKTTWDDTYNVDTEEYDEEQSGSDDADILGPGVHRSPTLWKKATSPPDNNQPDIEGRCTFLKERSEYGPIQYFRQYFEDIVLEMMGEKTNRRILQERGVIAKTTTEEAKKVFGCFMMMGLIGYPRTRFFWKRGLAYSIVADAMSRDRFFLIRYDLCCELQADIS